MIISSFFLTSVALLLYWACLYTVTKLLLTSVLTLLARFSNLRVQFHPMETLALFIYHEYDQEDHKLKYLFDRVQLIRPDKGKPWYEVERHLRGHNDIGNLRQLDLLIRGLFPGFGRASLYMAKGTLSESPPETATLLGMVPYSNIPEKRHFVLGLDTLNADPSRWVAGLLEMVAALFLLGIIMVLGKFQPWVPLLSDYVWAVTLGGMALSYTLLWYGDHKDTEPDWEQEIAGRKFQLLRSGAADWDPLQRKMNLRLNGSAET